MRAPEWQKYPQDEILFCPSSVAATSVSTTHEQMVQKVWLSGVLWLKAWGLGFRVQGLGILNQHFMHQDTTKPLKPSSSRHPTQYP